MEIMFKIENARYEEGNATIEAKIILLMIIKLLEQGETEGKIFDINQNLIGNWYL
jgi:hypothetical protein